MVSDLIENGYLINLRTAKELICRIYPNCKEWLVDINYHLNNHNDKTIFTITKFDALGNEYEYLGGPDDLEGIRFRLFEDYCKNLTDDMKKASIVTTKVFNGLDYDYYVFVIEKII